MVALSVVLAALLGEMAEKRLVELGAANLGVLTAQMARELSGGMNQFAKEAVNQTYRDRFRNPDTSPANLRAALEEFQRQNPEFSYISIVDARSARVVAATGGVFEGGSATGRPVFEEGRKGLFLGDVHDAVRLAELLPRPASGEPLRFLDVAAPIPDASGRVERVFAAHVGWTWTAQVRDNVLGPVAQRQQVELFLVDTAGKVVLSASPAVAVGTDFSALAAVPEQAAGKRAWPGGGDYLTAVAATRPLGSFAGFGWKVVARQPYALTRAAVRKLQAGFLAGGLAIGLMAAALAWMVTGRLVRPLRRLADDAERTAPAEGSGVADHDEVVEVATVERALARLADSAKSSADASLTAARQFEALAASLPQVVWLADARGRLEYANHDWIRQPAPGADEAFVTDIAQRVHAEDRAAFSQAWTDAQAGGRDMACRCRLLAPPGDAYRWFDIHARAVDGAGGGVQRWVGTLFDIDEIAALAAATRRALDEETAARLASDRLGRMRDEFLATVSHELRSPLNSISGWSEILARKRTDDPMIVKASESIRRNARQQAALIDDLMDMTAVIAGKMAIGRQLVDLAAAARNVFLSHLPAAQQKGVALRCPGTPPVVVQGEARRLEQVVSNLVGNAIKFTDAGGRVELSVHTDGAQACVRVEDTGRGIGADFLPFVFERMRQEDGSATRRSGGLGLGLAIARGIVELHGGTLAAESAGPGRGAAFEMRLPLLHGVAAAPDGASDDPQARQIGTALQGARILLVDDEPDAREVAQVALAGFGAAVRTASSAAEALHILDGEHFDALVSDIGMPGMDGLSLIRRLRAGPDAQARLPAVALSAFVLQTDVRAGLDAGFQAYVAKPISLARLYAAVAGAMEREPAPGTPAEAAAGSA